MTKQTAQRGQGGNTPANQSQLSAANLSEHELDDILSTRAAKRFLNENPDYYPTKQNSDMMQKFVRENGLNGHYSSSWQQAYDALSIEGRLEQRPGLWLDEWEEQPTERRTDGTVRSYHDAREIAALKNLPLKELKKLVDTETAKQRAALSRKGVRF